MKLIESKTLATAAASIEFTSIPQTFTDLVVVASIRSARGGGAEADDINFRFNGDSTAGRYTFRRLVGTGSSVSSSSAALDRGYLGLVSADGSTSNTFGNAALYIPNYSGASNKSYSSDAVSENNGTIGYQIIIAGLYSATTAISSILFFSDTANNFMAGSTISLYGVLKGSDGIVTTSP